MERHDTDHEIVRQDGSVVSPEHLREILEEARLEVKQLIDDEYSDGSDGAI